jgi:hypothetical protein
MTDQRLVELIEVVLSDITGRRIATETARRLAVEIVGDGYARKGGKPLPAPLVDNIPT